MTSLNTTNSFTCLLTLIIFTLPLQAQWIQQGPGPSKNGQVENLTDREIVGAINCVTPHRTDVNILYIGGTNGGVWRTINSTAASPSWTFISNDLPSQSIGALEFDPTDATNQTLVVGLGRTSSFSGFGTGNRGVFRTTTGTTPWTNIDPAGTLTNINITGLAARGAVIIVSTPNGIFRTINTGGLWSPISGAVGTGLPAGGSRDLVADPNDNNVLYTNSGTNGIYRSPDMGATWVKVSDAALDADLVGQGNIEMAVGNSNNVFVAIVRGGRLGDIYRSPNGLGTWTSLDIPITTEGGVQFGIHAGGQGNTHLSLAADPANANICYIGGDRQPSVNEGTNPLAIPFPNSIGANDYSGRLFRIDASLAAGSQASPITNNGTASSSSPHGDSRDMDFDANGDLLESDDGGVYRQTSPINATGDWFSLNGNSNVTEIHSIDWDKNSNIIIAGAQDNGTPQQEFPTNNKWSSVHTGDGGDVAVDDITSTATSTRYSSFQAFQAFRRRVYSSANTFVSQTFPALTNTATATALTGFSFVTPIKVNSQVGTRLIISANGGIFESLDQGNTVTNVSATAANNFGVDAIAYGAADNVEILYVGAGSQVLIRDAAAPDALTASATYPGGFVQGVALDPDDSQSAYVIDNDQVFETTNEGGAWADVTGNLLTLAPGALRSIAYMPNSTDDILAVGTDFGVFIAAGPAFNVWARLGTNLPQVGVMDIEYDRADGILLAGTMGRGAWTFNFSERDPVDVELVLDFSGSMLSPACGTCDTKLNVLKDAVEIFMQLWKGLAVTNDRIGVVYFRTNITKFTDAGATLLSVINKTDDMITDVRAQTSVATDLTALGGGVQSAINDLTTATRPRNVILFTDGMQNVNPGVVFPGLTIQNSVFSTNSNVTATAPATTLNAALGIKVNTIGVGATSAFETQLSDIASGTNGLTKITTAPDDELRRFFVEELVDALRSFSPQLVAYRKGTVTTTASESFSINTSGRHVIFKVSYKRGNSMAVSIRKGTVDVTQFAKVTRGAFYQIYSFPFERLITFTGSAKFDGPWTVNMRAQNVSYEIAAIVDEASLKYDLSAGSFPYKAGQPLKLKAKILVNGDPIIDSVTVTARVSKPNQSLGTLLSLNALPANPGIALEPNLPIGAQKLTLLSQQAAFYNQLKPVESGISLSPDASRTFVADFTNTTTPGTYTITYTIKGKHPFTGDFERVEQRIVVVKFAGFDMNASDLIIRKTAAAGNVKWTWAFTPKDNAGNFLGPDYGNVIKIISTNGTVQGIRDLGNGRYEIDIIAPNGVRPNIDISLYDEPWFNGLVPDAAGGGSGTPGGLKKWYGSVHAGASIPLSPFSNFYSTGFYGKLDLEYRIAKAFGIQVVAGINTFKSDLNVIFGAIQGKLYIPIGGTLSLTGEAGPGVYQFKGGNGYLGLDLGAGLDIRLTSGNRISLGINYVTMNNHPGNFKWLTAGVGFHF